MIFHKPPNDSLSFRLSRLGQIAVEKSNGNDSRLATVPVDELP